MSEQTVKCPICGKPYVFYSHYGADQSACPACRAEARSQEPYKVITTDNTIAEEVQNGTE